MDSKLKALILDSKLCLCYAGNISYADEAYRYYIEKSNQGIDWNHYLEYLLTINKKSGYTTDFILAGYNGNDPLIFQIKKNEINSKQSCWIGDVKSYSSFQEYYSLEISNNVQPKKAINNAFRKVLNNEISEAVGGFHFSIISNDTDYIDNVTGELSTVFEYQFKAESYLGRSTEVEIHGKNIKEKIPSGDSSSGSFALSHFISKPSQEHCVGVHFGHGNFGVFFPPKDLINNVVYPNVTAKEFLDAVYEEFKIELLGLEIIPDVVGFKFIKGGQ